MKLQYDDVKWIFSGIGITILTIIENVLFKKKRKKKLIEKEIEYNLIPIQ